MTTRKKPLRFKKKPAAKRKAPATLQGLLAQAAEYGEVSLTTTMLGSRRRGWVCYIRPRKTSSARSKWAVSSWGGQGPEPREAVRDAIVEAKAAPAAHFANDVGTPKIGGAEFDRDP